MAKELITISEIKTEILRLQRKAQSITQKTKHSILGEIILMMQDHDVSMQEISEALNRPPSTPAAPGPVKYRHPDGRTWSGRGRRPAWIKAMDAAGQSRKIYHVADSLAKQE